MVEIESRLAFQDNTIHELDRVVVSQARRIEELEKALKVLVKRLLSLEEASGQAGGEDVEPPPHY